MYYLSKIKGVKKFNEGVDMVIHIPDDIFERVVDKQITDVEIRLDDGRHISNEQRGKIFATLKDIALYTGDVPEYLRSILTYNYCTEAGLPIFSLSDCSIDVARGFINYLIEFVLFHNIPLSDIAINRTDDIDKYLYYTIMSKKCAVCGRNGEIHHALDDKVGMGNDRTKINNVGRKVVCLCRKHHTEIHTMEEEKFYTLHKIYPIRLTEYMALKLKM